LYFHGSGPTKKGYPWQIEVSTRVNLAFRNKTRFPEISVSNCEVAQKMPEKEKPERLGLFA
ncbi:hypothetical protein, partial [Cronobacter sakazakii]|uniref:hypothetical protein n=1 Tax=Cronobacter sakazakii TaxID=28141 RepID=UPI001C40013C